MPVSPALKHKIKKATVALGYRTRPAFMIIGAQKAGTSALFSILKQHELIKVPSRKELHYFDVDRKYNHGGHAGYDIHFPLPYQMGSKDITFEATPDYLYYPEAPQRLAKYRQDLKMIVILREPADRALSAWSMYHHHFGPRDKVDLWDQRDFGEAIAAEMKTLDKQEGDWLIRSYVRKGIYHEQLERFFKYFNREQLLILESSALKDDHAATIAQRRKKMLGR